MQVHAVPETERAFDASGRQLPWGIEYADSERRRVPEEKGPFGRSTLRRAGSRSRTTATPARKEDQTKIDNIRVIDDIFNSFKASQQAAQPTRQPSVPPGSLPVSASMPNLDTAAAASATPSTQSTAPKEPTEVILYGFGAEYQWAAIEFYERVSRGTILEDYDRHPPHSRYNQTLSLSRASAQRTLSATALRKKNTYMGGEHWIKVTFDSPEAADQACYCSPHNIHSYLVVAERFRGIGPAQDAPMYAAPGQTQSPSRSTSTLQGGTQTLSPESSSGTASSATATGANRDPPSPTPRPRTTREPDYPRLPGSIELQPMAQAPAPQQLQQRKQTKELPPAPLRIQGAKRAVLLPADQALLPVGSRWQQTFGSWPLVGWLVGGGGGVEIFGGELARKEDGSVDWEKTGWYWRVLGWMDSLLGTDFLGLKED
ncbi:hypothetical protein W97_05534 [Coniosporium apollinis CBS 100218]|uniref:Uncharacterized protein n=1 Tax=Coniosporium apollinis (strain CBS 100218) TaxID=1168221 RepID=R7YXN1_CONA1|nr:uncharacterized protein W97_05534 [Coniosporium apollinis CBS 100218]EON66436.1 hypothetical protein W97_05534 [Coniosporium apollinis CBS 100218]